MGVPAAPSRAAQLKCLEQRRALAYLERAAAEGGLERWGCTPRPTIRTENGPWMRVRARKGVARTGQVWKEPDHPILNPGGAKIKAKLDRRLAT